MSVRTARLSMRNDRSCRSADQLTNTTCGSRESNPRLLWAARSVIEFNDFSDRARNFPDTSKKFGVPTHKEFLINPLNFFIYRADPSLNWRWQRRVCPRFVSIRQICGARVEFIIFAH